MKSSTHDNRIEAVWRGVVDHWNRTPGYLKWIGGIVLGALVRYVFAHLFPESWERLERRLLAPTMPIWLAVGILMAVVALERVVPVLYRRVRAARGRGAAPSPLRRALGCPPRRGARTGSLLRRLPHPLARHDVGGRRQSHVVDLPIVRPRVQHSRVPRHHKRGRTAPRYRAPMMSRAERTTSLVACSPDTSQAMLQSCGATLA